VRITGGHQNDQISNCARGKDKKAGASIPFLRLLVLIHIGSNKRKHTALVQYNYIQLFKGILEVAIL
jgi:hypothetical protein